MRFTSGLSDAVNPREAIDTVCRQVTAQLAGQPCDVACVFASTVYRTSWPSLLEAIHERLQPKVLLGCSGSGIIGSGQEIEWTPAVSLVAAHLPGVRVFPFVVTPEELDQSAPGGFWVDKIGASPEANPVFVVFADPFTTQPEKFVEELNATYRTRPIVGGLVSGGTQAGEHLLFMGRDVRRDGVVGVGLTGNIAMETVVAQGCRPIGRPMIITKAEDHMVWELGGRQALNALHQVLAGLTPPERELAQRGSVFVGLAINEMRQAFGSGDFLIRNIVGIDPDIGAIAIADPVDVGQTLQFQLRDPATSRQELRRLLQRLDLSSAPFPPAGGLLFNCTGRGTSLYGLAHQDVKTIQTVSGKLPIGGFFCSGEIGPVGGTNFIHSYTASLGLFRPLTVPRPHQPLSTELKQPR